MVKYYDSHYFLVKNIKQDYFNVREEKKKIYAELNFYC